MRLVMLVASELATHGSVIAKPERISPSSSGWRNCSCCIGVPNVEQQSMLPVSGAAQLVASWASGSRPISSHNGAYSAFDEPRPTVPGFGEEEVPQAARASPRP